MTATPIEQLKREALAGLDRLDATLTNMPPLLEPRWTLADAQRAKRAMISAAVSARAARHAFDAAEKSGKSKGGRYERPD